MFEVLGEQISIWECIGFVFGIAGVWLTIKENILCFPVGIINVGIYSIIFFNSGLYSNAVLQVVYIVVLIYGWIHWGSNSGADEFQVTITTRNEAIIFVIIVIVTSLLFGYLLKETTNSPLPYWDAATTSISLVAQWMIARKKIENWLLWIGVDVVYVWMYIHQSLYLTAVLYFVFLILAVKGYFEWRKTLQKVSGALR